MIRGHRDRSPAVEDRVWAQPGRGRFGPRTSNAAPAGRSGQDPPARADLHSGFWVEWLRLTPLHQRPTHALLSVRDPDAPSSGAAHDRSNSPGRTPGLWQVAPGDRGSFSTSNAGDALLERGDQADRKKAPGQWDFVDHSLHPDGEALLVERIGAEERTRTFTPLRVHGPEPCASANSATSAHFRGPDPDPACIQPRELREFLVSQSGSPLSTWLP